MASHSDEDGDRQEETHVYIEGEEVRIGQQIYEI